MLGLAVEHSISMTAKCESPGGGRPGGARPGGARPGGARNCMIFRGDASGLVVDGQSLPIWIFMGSISLRFAALGTVRSSDRPCANLQFSPFLHRPLDENWKHRRVEIKSGWFLNSSSECAKLHSLPSLQRFELQYLQILVYFRESRICGVVIASLRSPAGSPTTCLRIFVRTAAGRSGKSDASCYLLFPLLHGTWHSTKIWFGPWGPR